MSFETILNTEPFALGKTEKETLLTDRLLELTQHHREKCPEYRAMLDMTGFETKKIRSYRQLPFLPVRLFKELSLKSVPNEEVIKTMTSSGTTGQAVSRIYLNRDTAANQQKTMVKIVSDFTGSARMPMIILDCPSVIKDRKMFSARGAGILGFSIFGTKKIYALDDDMKLDVEGVKAFLNAHKGEKILLFGFTFMVWQYFYRELVRLKNEGVSFDLSNGILIHGGGWKKLQSEAVDRDEFHKRLKDVCGLSRIHDYYGMVEQTGCIYMECECGHLHASIFSDVIVRNPLDFSECAIGEKGIMQVVSTLPESYPGHSLLTEDEGVILGEDDCPCGRKGKYFAILGRMKKAEIRGCSDTFAANVSLAREEAEDEAKNSILKDKVKFLVGDPDLLGDTSMIRPRALFDDRIIAFLQSMSEELMKDAEARAFPDVVTLGFWLRKGNLTKLKERFDKADGKHIGRGLAFHIAPSNVPVNFAYSLVSGLLCGNANVVRVPSKDFPQVVIIARIFGKTLEAYPDLKPYIHLVRYERDKAVNDLFSEMCDVRVIWGGDQTIAELRKSPIGPRATEITFADRYSLAVIDAGRYFDKLSAEGDSYAKRIAQDFYNDTYLSDQNACTSPRVVVWTGSKIEESRERFWNELCKLADEKYQYQDIQGIDKLSLAYVATAQLGKEAEDITDTVALHKVSETDNRLVRIEVDKLSGQLMDYRGNSGFFYEYETQDLMELRDLCDDTHCQTIGLLGDPVLLDELLSSGIRGVDRIAPIGHTMDFDLLWDGYDLTERMTRIVTGVTRR